MAYTQTLLKKFDRLTLKLGSRNQVERIEARFDMERFVAEHGRKVCEEMFEVLKQRDATSPPRPPSSL